MSNDDCDGDGENPPKLSIKYDIVQVSDNVFALTMAVIGMPTARHASDFSDWLKVVLDDAFEENPHIGTRHKN